MKIPRPTSPEPIPPHAEKVFEGVIFDVFQWQQEMFDGTKATFERLQRIDGVAVIPILEDGRILLCEQEQPNRAPYISAFGGGMEEGEDVLTTAKRELLEESGYEASEYTLWIVNHPLSKIDWVTYTFIARGLKKVADTNLDGGEKITPLQVTFDELVELVVDDRFVEKQMLPEFYKAKIDPKKMDELRTLFLP